MQNFNIWIRTIDVVLDNKRIQASRRIYWKQLFYLNNVQINFCVPKKYFKNWNFNVQ